MLNHVAIMGRLTRDPEIRKVSGDISIATFTLACERDFNSKSQKKETDFIECVAWRQTAEYISKYYKKGQMAVVNGRLTITSYKDKSENARQKAQVTIENIYSVPSAQTASTNSNSSNSMPTSNYGGYAAPAAPASDFAMLEDDDAQLPF